MIISGGMLAYYYVSDLLTVNYWKKIAGSRGSSYEVVSGNVLPEYRELYEKNPDMAGWLFVDGAHIDYPVMQTKDDPEHYLRLNFDGEYDYNGTPFIDYRCPVLPDRGFNTIIYGHNGPFIYLFEYAYKRSYPEYKYINFDTLYEKGVYEICSVYYSDTTGNVLLDPWDAEDEQAFTFYNYLSVDSPQGFKKFSEITRNSSLYETEASPLTMDDHLITLVCCASEPYSKIPENGRLVIVAKQVEDPGPSEK